MEISLPEGWVQIITNDDIPIYWNLSENIFSFTIPFNEEYLLTMYKHLFNKDLAHSVQAIKEQIKKFNENNGNKIQCKPKPKSNNQAIKT